MALRFSDVRFWVLFSALAIGVLVACSSSSNPPAGGADGAAEDAPGSMTQG